MDGVFQTVHTKVLVMGPEAGAGHGAVNMASGSLFISGSKLWLVGASSHEEVTSS